MSNAAVLKTNLRQKMDEAHLSDIALAKAAGLPRDAVRDIFRGKSSDPGVLKIAAIARQLGCSIEALLGSDNAALTPARESYSMVRRYDVRASMGPGAEGGDDVKERVMFPTQWLRAMTHAAETQLAIIEMDGDSMEPTLRAGDQGLVDLTQCNPRAQSGIYVLFTEGGLQVKRVSAHPVNGTLSIASDNPAYQNYEGVKPKDVRIIGRVIWIGRRI